MPATDTGAFSSPAQPGGAAQCSSQGRADFVRPASSAEDAARGPQVGGKRKHSDGSAEHLGTTGASGQSLQVADNPLKGAHATGLALSWPRNARDLNTVLALASPILPQDLGKDVRKSKAHSNSWHGALY